MRSANDASSFAKKVANTIPSMIVAVRLQHSAQVIVGKTLMKLLPISDYAIRVVIPSTSDTTPMSEIMVAGTPTGKLVAGAVFEAALKWKEYVLVFLTDDVPFEETLNIYLLDAHFNVVDSAEMYYMYSTGIFSDLDLAQPDTVRFGFFGGITWTLKLFAEKRFVLPIISDPTGVHKPFRFFRMFQIYGKPLPEILQKKICTCDQGPS